MSIIQHKNRSFEQKSQKNKQQHFCLFFFSKEYTHVFLDNVVEDAALLEEVWQRLDIRPHVLT